MVPALFEASLVESRTTSLSRTKRWTALTSITLQSAIVAIIIVLPMLHPQALPFYTKAPTVLLPIQPKRVVRADNAATTATSSAALSTPSRSALMPPLLPSQTIAHNDAPAFATIEGMRAGDAFPTALGTGMATRGPSVFLVPAHPPAGPVNISSGVSQGMLLTPIQPIYPAIAKAAHVQGRVIVEATISPTGTIESLHVLSGPAMLQDAAINAIRAARYQPYRLNGQPTAVQTNITVNFELGG